MPSDEFTRIRSLAALARDTGRSAGLNEIIEVAAEGARRAISAASVSVSRLEPGTGIVRTLLNVGELGPTEERWPKDENYNSDDFNCLSMITSGGEMSWTAVLNDPTADPREIELLLELGKGCSMGAPLVVDGALWGEFFATRNVGEAPFGTDETAYLEALTAILAGGISRALREESLEKMAYHDPLTGLANRRALDERAEWAFDHADGPARPVTVVMADINGLKKVNDAQGHMVGDQLIKAVASAMRMHFSHLPGTLVARVGGDEFTALVVGHDPAAVLQIADDLCGLTWNLGSAPASLSCGAATSMVGKGTATNPTELFSAADRAQYVAKRGRLRTTVLADDLPSQLADEPDPLVTRAPTT